MSDMFLTKDEIATLTGRKTKSKQIEALRKMALPFWVNAHDAPVVARAAIEGTAPLDTPAKERWVPNVLKGK
jgi:hypothetical protein